MTISQSVSQSVNQLVTRPVTRAPSEYVWLKTADDKYIGDADNETITIKVE